MSRRKRSSAEFRREAWRHASEEGVNDALAKQWDRHLRKWQPNNGPGTSAGQAAIDRPLHPKHLFLIRRFGDLTAID